MPRALQLAFINGGGLTISRTSPTYRFIPSLPFFTMTYYYDTYRDQLASLDLGHALWDPDPAGLYDKVRVGDVGFVRKGRFLCMFNAFLPADHSTQVYGVPEGFVPLITTSNNRMRRLYRGNYRSNTVKVENVDKRAAYVTSFSPA